MKIDENEKVRKTLYLDKSLCDKIEAEAEKDGRNFNAYVVRLFEKLEPTNG